MIEEQIYTRLTGTSALTALIGTRVYLQLMPQNPTYPAITYMRVSAARESAMQADPGLVHGRYQFDVFAQDADDARDVTEQLRKALQRWRGAYTGVTVQDTFIDNQQDLGPELIDDVPLYRTITDVMIHYTE